MILQFGGDLFQWLRSFYYAATMKSFADAAVQVNKTQSALTYQIQSLERELSTSLFVRIKNRNHLTQDGERLLQWTVRIFDEIERMINDVSGESEDRAGLIRILGNRPIFNSDEFIRAIEVFHQKYSKISFALNTAYPHDIKHHIRNGTSEFGIGIITSEEEGIQNERLFSSPCVILTNRNDGLRVSREPKLEELSSLKYIPFTIDRRDGVNNKGYISAATDRIFPNKSFISCANFMILIRFIEQGFGCSVIDVQSLKGLIGMVELNNISIFPIGHIFPEVEYGFITRSGSTFSRSVEYFMDIFRENTRSMDFESEVERMTKLPQCRSHS